MLCSLIAIQVPSEVTFGKKRDDRNYLVPKRILRDALGKPLKFIIVEDGVKANSNSDFSGAPVGNQLKFGEEFRVLDIDQDTKANFLCKLVDDIPVPYGWVNDDVALILTNGEAQCLLNPTTQIQSKALLIYKGDENELKGSEGLSKLTAKLGTSANAPDGQSINFYNILYIFKEKKNEKNEISKILLGFDPIFVPESEANIQDSLLGWFDAKYAYRWETREALEYDVASTRINFPPPARRIKPTPIFATSNDAEQAANKKSLNGLKIIPLEEEFEEGVSVPFNKNQSRYPIINIDKRRAKHPIQGNMYEIGVIGDFVSYGADGKAIDRISAADLEEQRNRLSEIKRQLDSTEILLVIDDTGSMRDFYQNYIPTWVEKLVGEIANGNGLRNQDVYVTICFYHDLDDNERDNFQGTIDKARAWLIQDAVTVIPRIQIAKRGDKISGDDGLKELVKKMKEHQSPSSGDPLEQMLFGIEHGLGIANKIVLRHARKLCFVIGDTGSHKVNIKGFSQNEQIPRIAKNLVPQGDSSPWELVAIQVPALANALQNDFELFRDQISKLEDAVKNESDERNMQNKVRLEKEKIQFSGMLSGSVNLFKGPKNADEVISYLQNSINKRDKLFSDFSNQTKKLSTGVRNPSGGTTIMKELRDKLMLAGVDVDRLSQSGAQLFYKGFVWEYDPQGLRQVRVKLLMSERDIAKADEIVETFIQGISDSDKNGDLSASVANAMVRIVSGDMKLAAKLKIGDLSVDEAILKKNGIYLNSFMFKRSLSQIRDMTFNETLQEINKIKHKQLLLKDIIFKQKREIIELKDEDAKPENAKEGFAPNPVTKWRVKAGSISVPMDRFFKFQATDAIAKSYIWIDLEDEFP